MTNESEQTRAGLRVIAVAERADRLLRANPDWRRGQAMFNALYQIDPALADLIRGTMADPFNNDSLIPAFNRAIIEEPTP